jgi:glycosyltransferase involved in cell wall biosynthesis
MDSFTSVLNDNKRIICLLQVNFNGLVPLGGAEKIALEVAKGFSDSSNVIILHGVDNSSELDKFRCYGSNMFSLGAFLYDDNVRFCGEIDPEITNQTHILLNKCVALFSFERVMKTKIAPLNIAVLGGTGYPHCEEVVRSSKWDRLIVPSKYVYSWCSRFNDVNVENICIIPNGINTTQLIDDSKMNNDYSNSILVPSRPDPKKGFVETIDLISSLNNSGGEYSVTILKQISFINNTKFYSELENYANKKKVNVLFKDWVPQSKIGSLFLASKLSTFLGSVPEGFGLSVIESIFFGTPVLAIRHGAVADLLPQKHGIIFFDEIDTKNLTCDAFEKMIDDARNDCIYRGKKFIKQNYNLTKMSSSYHKIIDESMRSGEFVQ